MFIAFEGIDGSGKSTQTKLLADYFSSQNKAVYQTCEPTFNPIGQMIRDIFSGKIKSNDYVIAGLFIADRLDHILHPEYGMLKNLEDGKIVITDRYYFSSFAYQGAHVPLDWVIEANGQAIKKLKADITFYIDLKPEISFERINQNRDSIDYYETLDNLKKVYDAYEKSFLIVHEHENIVRINGNQPKEQIHQDIIKYFEN